MIIVTGTTVATSGAAVLTIVAADFINEPKAAISKPHSVIQATRNRQ